MFSSSSIQQDWHGYRLSIVIDTSRRLFSVKNNVCIFEYICNMFGGEQTAQVFTTRTTLLFYLSKRQWATYKK